jgi:hypothetical protein
MTSHELDAVDLDLGALFAAGQAPPHFSVTVLRRIQEQRWRRERFLRGVGYTGAGAAGALTLVVLFFVPSLPAGDTLPVAATAVLLTLAATWRRLVPQF